MEFSLIQEHFNHFNKFDTDYITHFNKYNKNDKINSEYKKNKYRDDSFIIVETINEKKENNTNPLIIHKLDIQPKSITSSIKPPNLNTTIPTPPPIKPPNLNTSIPVPPIAPPIKPPDLNTTIPTPPPPIIKENIKKIKNNTFEKFELKRKIIKQSKKPIDIKKLYSEFIQRKVYNSLNNFFNEGDLQIYNNIKITDNFLDYYDNKIKLKEFIEIGRAHV